MPLTAFAVPLPITPQTIRSHPALQFYASYGQKFPTTTEQWQKQDYAEFYASDCKTILVDGDVLSGGEQSWNHFKRLYSTLPQVDRAVLSLIVVSDEEIADRHTVHAEFLTTLYTEDKRTVTLPQTFVYVLGKAGEGKGTLGLQIRELRNYYDLSVLETVLGEQR